VLAKHAGVAEPRIDAVLAEVRLSDRQHDRFSAYSLGMKQRLGVAAALLKDPDMLILDEPTNGLDPPGISWLRGLLREQAARGRAVLVSSHVLAEVAQSVDDVVVVAGGRLRAQGTLEQVLGGDDGPATEVRAQDPVRLSGALERRGHRVEREGDVLHVLGATPAEVGEIAGAERVAVLGLAARRRSLEDAFLALTGVAA
jgi:ABC-2 type transport system ATP-binding protein